MPVHPQPFGDWRALRTCSLTRRIVWPQRRAPGWRAIGDFACERDQDSPREGVRPPLLSTLEAILLLAREPLGSRKLAQLAGLADGTEARTLVRALNQLYDAEGCAFRVEEVAGGLQLMSRPKFAPWLRRLQAVPVEVRLSAPAMETLAVVAYRQPVLRAEIEAIRGVQCGEILRQLMERDLVRIVGRSEDLGRPFLYGTTRQFLQAFGLRHLDELPRSEHLRAGASGGAATSENRLPDGQSQAIQDSDRDGKDQEANVKATTIQPVSRPGAKKPETLLTRRVQDETRAAWREVEAAEEEEDFEDDEDDSDEDDEDYEEDLDEEDDEEEDDIDEDEDFEDDWEEVDDDDEDLDEDEEDEEEDEDWDDEDWDDEDDDDWDDDEDEEEEEGADDE